jgi:hypothetical protein
MDLVLSTTTGNVPARVAWACAQWGLIPVVGLVLGVAAICASILGFWRVCTRPADGGKRFAVAALILGTVEIAVNGTGIWLVVRGIRQLLQE